MEVFDRPVSELVPYANNAKKHDKRQIANVAESIKQYGFVQPVVVDKENVIVIGHCRVLAAKKLGMKNVPCVCVDDLTPEQVNALRLVDNKVAESEWDMELLADELPGVDLSAFDLDWGVEERTEVVEVPAPPIADGETRSHEGEVWQCGRHRVMCGDSASIDDVQMLTGGGQVDMLLTDPPYNVNYEGTAGKIKNDNMADEKFRDFLTSAFETAASVMKPGAAFHIWHSDTGGCTFREACVAAGLQLRQCLIWVKNRLVIGRQDFQWQHEPCLYGEKPIEGTEEETDAYGATCLYGWVDGTHYWFKNRKQTTLLYFDKPQKSADHPTMKPVKMFSYEMLCNTKAGEKVLDLFGGSGTTLMAAEQNGRTAYLMELDPRYCDVILKRWEDFTGEDAVLVERR